MRPVRRERSQAQSISEYRHDHSAAPQSPKSRPPDGDWEESYGLPAGAYHRDDNEGDRASKQQAADDPQDDR